MKKHGIGSRLLSLLLVLAMVLPVLPLNAFAAVGDIATDEKVGDTGLDGNIDPSDTISWPIKVYDYLNDGMLFEFANVNDATDDISDTLGGAYGGGMPAPQFKGAVNIIGTDYTVDWGYSEHAYTTWLKTYSAFEHPALEEAVNFVSPRHLHLVPKDTYKDMRPWIMSDFSSDNTASGYSRDTVRYAVVVYRTSGLEDGEAKLNLGWSTNLTGDTSYNYNYRGSVDLVPNSDKWNYVVIDMNAGTLGSKWSTITTVYKVFADFQMKDPNDSVDISHVAYFGTEFEAIEFGKDAVAFDNDPGEFLDAHTEYTDGTEVAVSRPSTGDNNGMDFSVADKTTGGYGVSTYATWSATPSHYSYLGYSVGGVKTTPVGTDERSYVSITNSHNTTDRSIFLWQYSGGDKLYYVTLVYKTTGFTADEKISFYTRDGINNNKHSSNLCTSISDVDASRQVTLKKSEGEWTTVTYAISDFADRDYNASTAYTEYGMYLPSCLTGSANAGKSLDIAMVWMNTDRAVATAYGKQAADYMNGKTEIVTGSYQTPQKKWNTGSNVAFGMLFSNYGGGWNYYDNTNGGENDWANGYYSYQIGQTVTTNPDNAQNLQRTEAAQKGYPVSDSIFLLNESATGMTVPYATNDLNFGYTLINTLTSGLYTAGLLESGLITVTDKYGNSYRVPNYKEETVEYIAQMLMDALSIGQTDTSGNYNYNFVKGTANGAQYGYDNGKALDLASALRKQLNVVLPENGGNCTSGRAELGNYADTAAKKSSLIGSFADCKDSITTFMDAAYYLLHNLYVDDSYNQAQDEYHYLVLSSATLETGETAYVFDGGFTTGLLSETANTQEYRETSNSAVNYDPAKGTISLTAATSKDQVYFQGTYTTTRFPFLPVTNSEGVYAGETKSPYFLDDGRGVMGVTEEGATFVNRNYNYAIACNGEFVYHAADDLFFKFEGDDDVYLFINGELVLDIGAAHSITDVSMKVNDYIVWAQNVLENSGSHTEAEVARANKLNLQEGESYSFDFYYMERHGYGANCRIVSNIRVTDPSIQTDKTAYQDDVEIEYGGIVNPDQPIEYSFSLTNTGNSKLYYLSFRDENIGLTLDAENGLNITGDSVVDKNGETLEVTDLVARVTGYDEDDNYSSIDVHFADNDALKAFLKDLTGEGLQQDKTDGTNSGSGLWTNSTVTIRGFAYKMTEEDKAKRLFDNTVISTANTQHDGEGKTLTGTDSHRVYIASEPLYYEWKDHALYITNEKFKTDVVNAGNTKGNPLEENEAIKTLNTLDAAKLKLTPCLKDGKEWPNDQVTYHADKKYLEVKFTTVGSHQVYVKITSSADSSFSLIVPVLFNVTDVQDRVYVLDYGLYADIPFSDLTANDVVSVPARVTDYDVMGITNTSPSYLDGFTSEKDTRNNLNRINFSAVVGNEVNAKDGKFILAADKLTFAPEDFMDEEYSSWIAITVHETDSEPSEVGPANTSTPGYSININKEVQMFQKVTVLPATVVYYEDDFPAIKYEGTVYSVGSEDKKTENTFTRVGSSIDERQEVDQEQEYGQDNAYKENSAMSAGTLTTIKIMDASMVASFQFKGTGFELISRTNASDSASLYVEVYKGNELIRLIPVITQFDNGNDGGTEGIYQVPVIRVNDLDWDTYTVKIYGVPARNYDGTPDKDGFYPVIPTYLYVDGLRIFQPLGDRNANYNDNENGAEFIEIRNQITSGFIAAVEFNGTNTTFSTGTTTWTENLNGRTYNGAEYTGNQVNSVEDYLTMGPNNEVYMDGTSADHALVFYVNETGSTVHNLQLAVHAVDAGLFYGTNSTGMNAEIFYGVKGGDGSYAWKPLVTVSSATEQYYTIPYSECPYVEGKGYQVVLKVGTTDADTDTNPLHMASFTTLKCNGLELVSIGGEATNLYYDNGVLKESETKTEVDPAAYMDFLSVSQQMRSTTVIGELE